MRVVKDNSISLLEFVFDLNFDEINFLWYLIFILKGLYFGKGVYQVLKSTYLDKLEGNN